MGATWSQWKQSVDLPGYGHSARKLTPVHIFISATARTGLHFSWRKNDDNAWSRSPRIPLPGIHLPSWRRGYGSVLKPLPLAVHQGRAVLGASAIPGGRCRRVGAPANGWVPGGKEMTTSPYDVIAKSLNSCPLENRSATGHLLQVFRVAIPLHRDL